MKLDNRTILITGGSSGIGFEPAKRLLERGNVVIITARSQEKLESTKRAHLGIAPEFTLKRATKMIPSLDPQS